MFVASWNTISHIFVPPEPCGTAGTGLFWRIPWGQKYFYMVFQEVANITLSCSRLFLRYSRPVLGCSGPFRVLVCTYLEYQIVPGVQKITLRVIHGGLNTFQGVL